MSDDVTDKIADISRAVDEGETIALMEPLLVRESGMHRDKLADLALELTEHSTRLKTALPAEVADALSNLVRSMNCYYSNLIEGHNTHPIDIERALNDDYSDDPKKRDLQLEAKAHIEVQRWIDEGGLVGRASSQDGILETHRRFCESLPEELLWVENPDTGERVRVVPGELRQQYVQVGRHIPVSPGALPRFLGHFEKSLRNLGRVDQIIASATAHQRLLWLHPFLDGNGRVARLMSYSLLRDALDTGGIWSVARGLARSEGDYKKFLASADQARRSDLDGRGNLSENALAEFATYFLQTCIDQVKFMGDLIEPGKLKTRIMIWAEEEIRMDALPAHSNTILEAVLYRGELPKGEVATLLRTSDRNARRITSALVERGVLTSSSTRAPFRIAFPATLAERWMPGLFPDKK